MADIRITSRIKTIMGDYKVYTLFEPWSNGWLTICSKHNRVLTSFPSRTWEAAGQQHLSICNHFHNYLQTLPKPKQELDLSIKAVKKEMHNDV